MRNAPTPNSSSSVAIKVVHGGALSRAVQSRLKIERQILAQLDHPNIAHLLDGGTLPDGTAYLVMEYIDGVPIDTFCDTHRLDVAGAARAVRHRCAPRCITRIKT